MDKLAASELGHDQSSLKETKWLTHLNRMVKLSDSVNVIQISFDTEPPLFPFTEKGNA